MAATEILAPPAVVQTVTTGKTIANGETKTWQDWTIDAIPAYNLQRGPAPGKLFHSCIWRRRCLRSSGSSPASLSACTQSSASLILLSRTA